MRGECTPLGIYPEGATTNGTHLIQFKRGAFQSLLPVKPFVNKITTLSGVSAVHGDASTLLAYINILVHCVLTFYTTFEMPVFEPNEYFWKNHWDGKEEKWVAYARAVRTLMAETGGLKLSNSSMEDKMTYKKLIRGTAKKQV